MCIVGRPIAVVLTSARSIDLTGPSLDLLRTHRVRQAERMLALGHRLTDGDLIFCDDTGEPLWGRHVTTRHLQPLLRRADLPSSASRTWATPSPP
jgi:hypothetical protein